VRTAAQLRIDIVTARLLAALAAAFPLHAPTPARATEAPPAAGLLADPAALAGWIERTDPAIAAAAARIDAARADHRQAGLWPNPELDLGAGNVAIGQKERQDVDLAAAWSVGLSQTVELGKRGPRTEAARLRLAAAQEAYRALLGTAVAEARAALGEVAWRAARQQVLEESLALAEEAAAVGASRRRYGEASGADLARLELDTLRLRSEVERNRAALQAARAACDARLALPCAVEEDGAGLLRQAAPLPEQQAQEAEAQLDARPHLRALTLEARAAEADATLAARRALPDPAVRLGYEHDRFRLSNDDPYTLQLGVVLPLPLFDRGTHEAAAARARARELEALRRANARDAAQEQAGLLRRLQAVEETLGLLESEALPRSDAIERAAQLAYEQGEYGATELLLAQRERLELRLELADLSFERFALRNELRRNLGLDAAAAPTSER